MPLFFSRRLFPALLIGLLAGAAGCIDKSTVKVNSLKLNGVKAVKPGQLKSVLATAQSSKLPWGAKHYFTREQFEADLKRMTAFYKDRGYPDAKVKSFDVKMNGRQDAVDVIVNIDEGQPILVEQIEYEGFDVLPAQHLTDLKARVPLKEKSPLDRAFAQATRETVLDEVKDHGYPYATVRLTERQGSNDHARILTLTATPGVQAHYGEVEIVGNKKVSDNVVKRQMVVRPGRLYRLSSIQESQRRLYDLGAFQFVNVEAEIKEGEQPPVVPMKTTLTEGKLHKVTFGVGYGTEEKGRVSADWRNVNFLGGARTLQAEGSYSALAKGGRVNFKQPYFFGPRSNLLISGQSFHRNEPAYVLNTNGGRVTLEKSLGRRGPFSQRAANTTMSLSYTGEFQSYRVTDVALHTPGFFKTLIALGLDPLNGEARGLLSSLDFDLHRSTADSTLDAKHGYVLNGHVEQAGKMLGGDYEFTEALVESRYYLPIADKAVLAVKARAGSIGTIGGDSNLKVPFYRRYFLGGASSLRGWGRFEVSPLFFGEGANGGVPVGGHTMVESSAELRVPVWGNVSAVLFADAGNVWNNAWDFNLNELRYDIGPGIRYMTPIGPLRADLGYQLNPIEGLLVNGKPQVRRLRFHFSIGQAF